MKKLEKVYVFWRSEQTVCKSLQINERLKDDCMLKLAFFVFAMDYFAQAKAFGKNEALTA